MMEFLEILFEPLREVFARFSAFLPNLLAMLVILAVGILLALLLRKLLQKFLTAVGFDSWSDRMGFTTLLRKGNLWMKPAVVLANLVFWLLIIVTLMVGLGALDVESINDLVGQFFSYLPRVLLAAVLLLFGYVVASFISRAVLIAASNGGHHYAKLLAEAVRLLLLLVILAMVLEQLQIATSIVLAAFSILFGGIVIALAIAFGVGGIGTARRIIEREFSDVSPKEAPDEIEHL